MTKLNTKAIDAIRKDTKLKGELQMLLNISGNTLYTWLKNNDSKLTQVSALDAISKSTGLTGSDLLTI
jgi:DNA-binding transcriptional regulator YiaG